MIRAPSAALASALAAVTDALRQCRISVVRHSPAAALYRISYEHSGCTVGAVSFADGMFVDPDLPAEVAGLIRSHAHLACAARSPDPTFVAPDYGGSIA
jgi:hypothetical protein